MQHNNALRYLCLWIPDWPIIASCLSHDDDPYRDPIAIVHGTRISYANSVARHQGIRQGMSLRHARSLCAALAVHRHRPEQWDALFDPVAHSVGTVVADPCIVRPGIVVASARRATAWVGSEEEACECIDEAVTQYTALESFTGAGQGILTSILASREGRIVPSSETATFLSAQPIAAVRLAVPDGALRRDIDHMIEICSDVGLRTLGDVAGLGKQAVMARFGENGLTLWNYATGTERLSLRPTACPEDLSCEHSCDPPIDNADHALFVIKKLADDLCEQLEKGCYACDRLVITFQTHHQRTLERSWLIAGTPHASQITDRARWQIDSWLSRLNAATQAYEEQGIISRIILTATGLTPTRSGGHMLWGNGGGEDDQRINRAVERLHTLAGNYRVFSPQRHGARRYETRISYEPWQSLTRHGEEKTHHCGQQPAHPSEQWWGSLPSPVPSLLLRDPLPLDLQTCGGQEVTISARGILNSDPTHICLSAEHAERYSMLRIGRHAVDTYAGPWLISDGWWKNHAPSAYLHVVCPGLPPLLLMRQGGWKLLGIYD